MKYNYHLKYIKYKFKYLKFKFNKNIYLLLNKEIDINNNHPMIKLKYLLKQYIIADNDLEKINKAIKEYSSFNEMKHINDLCKSNKEEHKKLCNTHGGDLFEHSQWCALQIIDWFKNKDPLIENLDLETCIISAFFHDIGKGYDCIYNIYDKKKYNGKDHNIHTKYSGDIILGLLNAKVCENVYTISFNIRKLINLYFPNVNIKDIALAAYMHWEFGRNISLEQTYYKYVKKFIKYSLRVGYTLNQIPSLLPQLKLCIITSCADIASGTNIRLLNYDIVAEQKYPNNDIWIKYHINKKYINNRKELINYFLENNNLIILKFI